MKFEAYFEVLYLLWVVDSLRTLKIHHCFSLVTIVCLNNQWFSGWLWENLNFEIYLRSYTHFTVHFRNFQWLVGAWPFVTLGWVMICDFKFKRNVLYWGNVAYMYWVKEQLCIKLLVAEAACTASAYLKQCAAGCKAVEVKFEVKGYTHKLKLCDSVLDCRWVGKHWELLQLNKT